MIRAGHQTRKRTVLSKAEAGYHAPDHRCPCVMCRHFDAYRSACSVVAGSVRSDATCDHWHTAEGAAAEQRGVTW
jgi:hypothetical protein